MIFKLGSTGENVKKIQHFLAINETANFDTATETAVKNWQTKNGLVSDGIVGDKSLTKMGIVLDVPKLDISKLKGVIPDTIIDQIPGVMEKFKINTVLRLSHLISQCQHESNNFKVVSENLNYSSAGLMKTFGKYFTQPGLADQYAHNPEKIASRVYANRIGNGDEASHEGWKYRGRGTLQITGKANYKAFSDFIGEDCVTNPDLVSTKYSLASAAWFFSKNGLNEISDLGASDEIVTKITKKVNGGLNGYEERLSNFKKIYNILK